MAINCWLNKKHLCFSCFRIKLFQFYSKTIWRKLSQFITFKVFGKNPIHLKKLKIL
jgi:hypothetical protein